MKVDSAVDNDALYRAARRFALLDNLLSKVLPKMPLLEFLIWLVTHRAVKTCQRVRVVFDLLASALSETI